MPIKRFISVNKNATLPEDFDWKTYVALNKDLKDFSETKAKNHYLIFGINENRKYKINKRPIFYDKKLVTYNTSAILPEDFDWKTYVSLNNDLKDFSETKAKNHYLIFGINENRKYKINKRTIFFYENN